MDPCLRSEGHDHAVTLRGEHWRNFDVAMDVVRVAVQKQDLLPSPGPASSYRIHPDHDAWSDGLIWHCGRLSLRAFKQSDPVAVSPVVPTKAFCRKRLRFASVRSEIRFC